MSKTGEIDTKNQELLTRGVSEVVGDEQLKKKLINGDVLRVKLGIDPTSPHLHLGRAVPLLKLHDFQQLGHKIIFIVGDFTGVIGDTSDKESERPMLTKEEVEINMQTYIEQVGKILDVNKVEIHHNSEWLQKLTYSEIGEHADQFSVAGFIARENIKRRLDAGKRVSLREMLYPLMQGYDSVAVEADVEVGGTDQRFNILAGRTLQEHYKQQAQAILLNPLVEGLDGRKMSSSWGNTINLSDSPQDMYGKVMSLSDELVGTYLEVCTRVSTETISEMQTKMQKGELHPKELKMFLADEIVSLYSGEEQVGEAREHFVSTFQNKEIPKKVQEVAVTKGELLMDVLKKNGLVASNSEFRRLIESGGVHIVTPDFGDITVADTEGKFEETVTIRIGKRRFVRFVV